MPGTNGSH